MLSAAASRHLSQKPPILEEFARIRGELRAKGQLIGDLDLLIAATALHHDLSLLIRNTRHSGALWARIPDLKLYPSS